MHFIDPILEEKSKAETERMENEYDLKLFQGLLRHYIHRMNEDKRIYFSVRLYLEPHSNECYPRSLEIFVSRKVCLYREHYRDEKMMRDLKISSANAHQMIEDKFNQYIHVFECKSEHKVTLNAFNGIRPLRRNRST